MKSRLSALFRKEMRQVMRSRKTVAAAAAVPALMLLFVTGGDILTLRLGFGNKPIYLLSSSHAVSGSFLLRHYTLPILITISGMVTPSIVMGDLLWGEKERRTIELLVALPLTILDMVLAKLAAVLLFAVAVTVPLFALNVVLVSATGYGSATQTVALSELLLAAIAYSAVSALLITLLTGEARAANIISGLILGPIVPTEGLILSGWHGLDGVLISAMALFLVSLLFLAWSLRLLSWERLAAA